ncbi:MULTISPECIES: MerR family transcriptional regulator [unclassified Streptomyces]|uniref:MerR family transcriptional regulator n=1 Tax=unclassified Streptomyces TaxID=2593676 RepID=UPI003627A5D2
MRIGELATRTGASVRALRYYEEQNLLTSERSPGGQRQYPESAVDRIQLIQQLYAAGLSSKVIVELMPCVVDGNATPELLDRLSAERDRIDGHIADLVSTRSRLDSVITGAGTQLRTGLSCRNETTGPGSD